MLANDGWRVRQLFASTMEAFERFEYFQHAYKLNTDDLDKGLELHRGYSYSDFSKISFETFVELGKSLRVRQAHKNTHRIQYG